MHVRGGRLPKQEEKPPGLPRQDHGASRGPTVGSRPPSLRWGMPDRNSRAPRLILEEDMIDEPGPSPPAGPAGRSRFTAKAGAATLVVAGLALLVGGLWWVDGDVRAVAAFLFGSALVTLGCFFPRVRGNIIIGKEGATIPVDALVEGVVGATRELPEIQQLSPLQAVEVVDQALRDLAGRHDLEWDPALQTMTIGPARSGLGSGDLLGEAVRRAADAVLIRRRGDLIVSRHVQTQRIPADQSDPNRPVDG